MFPSHDREDLQLWNNVRILKERGFQNIKIMSPSDYIQELCHCSTTISGQTIYPKMVKGNSSYLFKEFCLIEGALANNKVSILSKKYQQLIETIENCDVFFFSGSGTINTRHCYGLMVFLTPIMIASYLKKPIILSGQGFTPMNNIKLEQFIGGILNKVNKIFTRDFQEGYRALKRTKIDSGS